MKTTTFLSLAGLAAAAGTAFALNSSVLDATNASPLSSSVISVVAAGTATMVDNPITNQTVVGQVQASSVGSSVGIPDVGDVIVSGNGTSFQIVEALPKQGWKAERVSNDGPRPKMHFTNGTSRVEVEIVPQADGTASVVATPDNRTAAPTPSLPANGSPVVTIAPLPGTKPSLPGSIRGDDDDDDHHGDHHDDDDDHDEDEDDEHDDD